MEAGKFRRPAIAGGAPAVTIRPPAWPMPGKIEEKWMAEVVRSGNWSWLGLHERAFCKDYAKFIGGKYCLCLSNGTVTLQCALQAVGVVPGDEVIVPGMTWVATAQAALDVGADVVLVDVDPETLCIDPKAIEKAITRRTKAIVPVHIYGCMCDMDAIMKIASKHKLKVVEDVAHQHGSRWRNKGAGAIGDVGSYSFQQSKILTSGEGGALVCNDRAIYETLFALKHVGWKPKDARKSWFDDLEPGNRYGRNFRCTEMQCVLLRGGLSRLAAQNRRREDFVGALSQALDKMGGPLRAARRDPRITRQAYYAMTLVYDPDKAGGLGRSDYCAALQAEGCRFGGIYAPVYSNMLLNLYDSTSPIPYRDPKRLQKFRSLKLPNVERACRETAVTLSHTHLLGSRAYMGQILAAVRKVNDNLAKVKDICEARRKAAK